MKFTILTLFPEAFTSAFSYSILRRAQEKKAVEIKLVDIRDWAFDKYKTVDDKPYGGGVGMVMKVDVIDRAIQNEKEAKTPRRWPKDSSEVEKTGYKQRIILLDPKGKLYNQKIAQRLSKYDHLILVCGHYEGVDERVKKLVDESLSIGDYILTGGEIPAMAIVDSVTRLIPQVLKKPEATINESFQLPASSFQLPMLEYPQYTRPSVYKSMTVPKILLSGNRQQIKEWREKQALKLTKRNRPDLFLAE